MRPFVRSIAFVLLLSLVSAPAFADATAFAGISSEPSSRRTLGLALGMGLLIVGFEFEYSRMKEELEELTPGVSTYMGNVLLQTPVAIHGVQFYGTAGAGPYRLTFDPEFAIAHGVSESELKFGTNIGGGVKIGLAGPLRLRLDYRVFVFKGEVFAENPQRFYAGLNLAF